MEREVVTQHRNVVLAEPAMMLEWAFAEVTRRGYQGVDMGARVTGDVAAVANEWGEALRTAGPRSAIVGVGELTVRVDGSGEGGAARSSPGAWRESCRTCLATPSFWHVPPTDGTSSAVSRARGCRVIRGVELTS